MKSENYFDIPHGFTSSSEGNDKSQIKTLLTVNQVSQLDIVSCLDKYRNSNRENYRFLGIHKSKDFKVRSEINSDLLNDNLIVQIGGDIDEFIAACKINKNVKSSDLSILSNRLLTSMPCDHIGYQRHLVNYKELISFDLATYQSLSLGKLHNEVYMSEPMLRNKTCIFLDLAILKSSEAKNVTHAVPTGINSELLAQIGNALGKATNLKYLAINPSSTEPDKGVNEIIATFLWYFLEARKNRIEEHPREDDHFNRYIVQSLALDEDIEFYKSEISQKWWVKIRDHFIPSTLEEYDQAMASEVPLRLIRIAEATR